MGLADGMAWERDYGWMERKLVTPPPVQGGDARKAERIKALAETHGVLTAKRMIERQDLVADINAAQSIADIKALLLRMADPL